MKGNHIQKQFSRKLQQKKEQTDESNETVLTSTLYILRSDNIMSHDVV